MPRPSEKELNRLIARARESLEAGQFKVEANRILDLKILLEACHRSNAGYYERIEELEGELKALKERPHAETCLTVSSPSPGPQTRAAHRDAS